MLIFMERRNFIKKALYTATGLVVVGGGATGFFHYHFSDRNHAKRILNFSNLQEALNELDRIEKAAELQIAGDWSLYQNLIHCTQSIEFSLLGYPENKPALFQKTIGKLVFHKFEGQGYMRHNRNEPIPKAPEIIKNGDLKEAFTKLRKTISDFEKFQGNLAPHFAYGQLSKVEYTKAHAFHLADHFSAMDYKI